MDEKVLLGALGEKKTDGNIQTDIMKTLDGEDVRSMLGNKNDEAEHTVGEAEVASEHFNEHFDIPLFSSKQSQASTVPSNDDDGASMSLRILEDNLGIDILSLEIERRKALLLELSNLILRTLEGLNNSMRVKEQMKQELRLPSADKLDNNPIKLGKSASNLLQNAEIGERLGLMRLSEAVVKSFAEIDAHMIALHGASKNALETAASAFAPKTLEYKFESMGSLKGMGTRSGLAWRAYCKMFEDLNKDPTYGVEIIMPHFSREYQRLLFSVNLATANIIRS
jgi:predicted component of type VI protein secretion system